MTNQAISRSIRSARSAEAESHGALVKGSCAREQRQSHGRESDAPEAQLASGLQGQDENLAPRTPTREGKVPKVAGSKLRTMDCFCADSLGLRADGFAQLAVP